MVQEIITYTIIALAVAFTFRKSIKKFSKKKSFSAHENLKKEATSAQHKCTDCEAECILRNTISPSNENVDNLCKRIDISSD